MVEFPITAIVGPRGSCKTLLMTGLSLNYEQENRKIFTNFTLYGIDFDYIDFATLADLPEYLYDAVVFLDEMQVGADAYDFLKKSTRDINTFVTQLRKRRITLFYSTQVYLQVNKRLRLQTNYILEMQPTPTKGVAIVTVIDRGLPYNQQVLKRFTFDGRPFFNNYDTNEVIGMEHS